MVKDIQAGKEPKVDEGYLNALGSYLKDPSLDKAFVAKALELPSAKYIGDQMDVVDVDAVAKARSMVSNAFVNRFEKDLVRTYDELDIDRPFEPVAKDAGERALKNKALSYLASTEKPEYAERVTAQYEKANNMTDRLAALNAAAGMKNGQEVVADFYNRFKDEELVVNKWLGVVASEGLEGAKKAVNHEAFAITNPNKVRSVMRRFTGNQKAFHAKDGSGYEFVADMALKLDGINPLVAADVAKPLASWRRFDPERQELMKASLEKIMAKPGLSKNVYEVVSKALDGAEDKKTKILENKAKMQKRAKTDAFLKREPLKVFVSGANGKVNTPVHSALLEGTKAKVVTPSTQAQAAQIARNKVQGR